MAVDVRRIGHSAAVLALALVLGLHWTALQLVAWTGMVVNLSRDHRLGAALTMTFDGQHPCALCKVVQEGRRAERQREPESSAGRFRLEATWESSPVRVGLHRPGLIPPTPLFLSASRPEAPPKPRPRPGRGQPLSAA